MSDKFSIFLHTNSCGFLPLEFCITTVSWPTHFHTPAGACESYTIICCADLEAPLLWHVILSSVFCIWWHHMRKRPPKNSQWIKSSKRSLRSPRKQQLVRGNALRTPSDVNVQPLKTISIHLQKPFSFIEKKVNDSTFICVMMHLSCVCSSSGTWLCYYLFAEPFSFFPEIWRLWMSTNTQTWSEGISLYSKLQVVKTEKRSIVVSLWYFISESVLVKIAAEVFFEITISTTIIKLSFGNVKNRKRRRNQG